jgi:hypothetical protein
VARPLLHTRVAPRANRRGVPLLRHARREEKMDGDMEPLGRDGAQRAAESPIGAHLADGVPRPPSSRNQERGNRGVT